MRSVTARLAVALSVLSVLVVAPCLAQPASPTVTHADPIAGISLQIPDDWDVGTSDWGFTLIGMDAGGGSTFPSTQPILWTFFTQTPPQQTATDLAQGFSELTGTTIQPHATANAGEWGFMFTAPGAFGDVTQRWLCRQDHGINYAIAVFRRPEYASNGADDVERALATCHLIAGPAVQRMREPSENAYTMWLPQGWQWEGHIVRTADIPGAFEWKVMSPDGTCGAFNSPPGAFNIMVPYTPAGQCAQSWVLQGLAQQLPGVRLEAVHEMPRASTHFADLIRMLGLGANPQVHRVRADYLATINGTPVRIRCSIVTFMLDASPLLGGRGDWTMFTSGAWAPVDQFDQLYPIGRGVLASLATDPDWKERQQEAVFETANWRKWVRRVFEHIFIERVLDEDGRLRLKDTLHLPGL